MRPDGLECDIETILECRENEESDVLQRLSSCCQHFHSRVVASVESYLNREKDYVQKCKGIGEQIAELHSKNKDRITVLENTILEQKVVDKKLAIVAKQQAKQREDIEDAKSRKESIALELVDLMQEFEDGRKERRERWDAIKMACSIYKEKLDFHIEFKQSDDHERVQVTFFRHKNPDRDSYYVYLLDYKSHWKVGHIEPALKKIHLKELQSVIDFKKPLDVLEVIVFLCALRSVFSKHYFKE